MTPKTTGNTTNGTHHIGGDESPREGPGNNREVASLSAAADSAGVMP